MKRISACFSLMSLIFLGSILTACSQQKLADFAETEPAFSLLEFFEGNSIAYGIFEDRFGTLKRRFKVNIAGEVSQQETAGKIIDQIVLTEDFIYEDGETQQRIWTISKKISEDGNALYQGVASDVTSAADSVGCQNGSILSSVLDTARPLMTAPDGSFVPAEDATTVHFQQDIPGCS